jgi:DNA-binding MarR family transcriptional regulator
MAAPFEQWRRARKAFSVASHEAIYLNVKISQPDHVDIVLAQWANERPDVDTRPFAIVGRIGRAGHLLDAAIEDKLAAHGLSRWSWDVLTALRRTGRPYRLTPTSLYRELMRTSGAISNRLKRLEDQGLVRRVADPADGRGVLVELTPAGKRLVDKVIAEHLDNERRLVAGLSRTEQRELSGLLRKLLLTLEPEEQADADRGVS